MAISQINYEATLPSQPAKEPGKSIDSIDTALEIIKKKDSSLAELCFAERKILEFKKTTRFLKRIWPYYICHYDKKAHTAVENKWKTELDLHCTEINPTTHEKITRLSKVLEKDSGKKFFHEMLIYFGIDTLLKLSFTDIQYIADQTAIRLSKEQQEQFFIELSKGNLSDVLDIIRQIASHDPRFAKIINETSPKIKMFFETEKDQSLTLEQIRQEIFALTDEKEATEKIIRKVEEGIFTEPTLKNIQAEVRNIYRTLIESFSKNHSKAISEAFLAIAKEKKLVDETTKTLSGLDLLKALLKKDDVTRESIKTFLIEHPDFAQATVTYEGVTLWVKDVLPYFLENPSGTLAVTGDEVSCINLAASICTAKEADEEFYKKLYTLYEKIGKKIFFDITKETEQRLSRVIATEEEQERAVKEKQELPKEAPIGVSRTISEFETKKKIPAFLEQAYQKSLENFCNKNMRAMSKFILSEAKKNALIDGSVEETYGIELLSALFHPNSPTKDMVLSFIKNNPSFAEISMVIDGFPFSIKEILPYLLKLSLTEDQPVSEKEKEILQKILQLLPRTTTPDKNFYQDFDTLYAIMKEADPLLSVIPHEEKKFQGTSLKVAEKAHREYLGKILYLKSRLSHLRQIETHKQFLLGQKIAPLSKPLCKIESLERSPFDKYQIEFFQNATGQYEISTDVNKNLLCLGTLTIKHPSDPSQSFTYGLQIPIKEGSEKNPIPILETIPLPITAKKIVFNGQYFLAPTDDIESQNALSVIQTFIQQPSEKMPELTELERCFPFFTHAYDSTKNTVTIFSSDDFSLHTYTFIPSTKLSIDSLKGSSDKDQEFLDKVIAFSKQYGDKIIPEKLPGLDNIPHTVVMIDKKKKAILFNKGKFYTYAANTLEPDPHSDHEARMYLAKMAFKTGNNALLIKALEPVVSYGIGELAPKGKSEEASETRIGKSPELIDSLEDIFFSENSSDITRIAAQIRVGTLLKKFEALSPDGIIRLNTLIINHAYNISQKSPLHLTLAELRRQLPSIEKSEEKPTSSVPKTSIDPTTKLPDLIHEFSLDSTITLQPLKDVLTECTSEKPDEKKVREYIKKSHQEIKKFQTKLSERQKILLEASSTTIERLQEKPSELTKDENTILSIERTKQTLDKIIEGLEGLQHSTKAIQPIENAIADLKIDPFDPKEDLKIRKKVSELSAAVLPENLLIKSSYYELVHKLHTVQHIADIINTFLSDTELQLFHQKSKEEQEDLLEELFATIDSTISSVAIREDFRSKITKIIEETKSLPKEKEQRIAKCKTLRETYKLAPVKIDPKDTFQERIEKEIAPFKNQIIDMGRKSMEEIFKKITEKCPAISLEELENEFKNHKPSEKENSPFFKWLQSKGAPEPNIVVDQTKRLMQIKEEISYAESISAQTNEAVNFLHKHPLESIKQYKDFTIAYEYALRHPPKPKTNPSGFAKEEYIKNLAKTIEEFRSNPSSKRDDLKKIIAEDVQHLHRCKQIAENEAALRRTTLFSYLNKGLPLNAESPTIEFLMIMYARHRPQEGDASPFIQYLKNYNKNADLLKIVEYMQAYLTAYQEFQQIERVEKALEDITIPDDTSDRAITSDTADKLMEAVKLWKATRQYDSIAENPHIQVFEVIINSYLLQPQIQTINNYADIDSNVLSQLLMGGGKTFALLPLIALFRADGKHLSTIMVPGPLLPTVVSDMIQRLGSDFATLLYQCPAISPGDPLDKLQEILYKMKETIAQRGCLITSPDKRHSFFNALTSYMQEAKKDPEKIKSAICMAQILKLIESSEVVLADEIDDILKLNLTYIVSLGDPKQFPDKEARILGDMFEIALTTMADSNVPVVAPDKDKTTILSKEVYREKYLPKLAQEAAKLLKKEWPRELSKFKEEQLITYLQTVYIDPTNEKSVGEVWKEFENCSDVTRECLNQLAGIRSWLQSILLDCLNAAENKDYGVMDLQETPWATPFEGPNTPASTTFSNPYQLLTYTLQAYKLKRIPAGYFKHLLDKSSTVINPYIKKLFPDKDVKDVTADEIATKFDELKQKNDPLWSTFVKNVILSIVVYHEKSIVSDSHKLATGSRSASGFSGTTYNVKTMSRFTQTNSDIATEADTLAVLHAKSEKKDAMGGISILQPSTDNLLQLIQKQAGSVQALVDCGGWLSSYKDGAEGLALELLKDDSLKIKQVVFHDKEGKLVKGILDEEKKLKTDTFDAQKEIAMEGRFTIYGMKYTVGTDIKQLDKSKCLLTTSASMILRDDLQGIFRMRKIKAGEQGAVFALNQETAKAINETIDRDITKDITYDELMRYFITNQNQKVEKDLQQACIGRMKNRLEKQLRQDLINTLTGQTAAEEEIHKKATDLFDHCQSILITKQEDPWSQYGSIPRLITKEQRREKDVAQQLKIARNMKKPFSDEKKAAEETKRKEKAFKELEATDSYKKATPEIQETQKAELLRTIKEALAEDGDPYYTEEELEILRRQYEKDYPIDDLPDMLPEHDGAQTGKVFILTQLKTEAKEKLEQSAIKQQGGTEAERQKRKQLLETAKMVVAPGSEEQLLVVQKAKLELCNETLLSQTKMLSELKELAKKIGVTISSKTTPKIETYLEGDAAIFANEQTIKEAVEQIEKKTTLDQTRFKAALSIQGIIVTETATGNLAENVKAVENQKALLDKILAKRAEITKLTNTPLGQELAKEWSYKFSISSSCYSDALKEVETLHKAFTAELQKRSDFIEATVKQKKAKAAQIAVEKATIERLLADCTRLTVAEKEALIRKTTAAKASLATVERQLGEIATNTYKDAVAAHAALGGLQVDTETTKNLQAEFKVALTKEISLFGAQVQDKQKEVFLAKTTILQIKEEVKKASEGPQKDRLIELLALAERKADAEAVDLAKLKPTTLEELKDQKAKLARITISSTKDLEDGLKTLTRVQIREFQEKVAATKIAAIDAQLAELEKIKASVDKLGPEVQAAKDQILQQITAKKSQLVAQRSTTSSVTLTSLDDIRRAKTTIDSLAKVDFASVETARKAAQVLQQNIVQAEQKTKAIAQGKTALQDRIKALPHDTRLKEIQSKIDQLVLNVSALEARKHTDQASVSATQQEQRKLDAEISSLTYELNQHAAIFCREVKEEAQQLLEKIAQLGDQELKRKAEKLASEISEKTLFANKKDLADLAAKSSIALKAMEETMRVQKQNYAEQLHQYHELEKIALSMGTKLPTMKEIKSNWSITSLFNKSELEKAQKEQLQQIQEAKKSVEDMLETTKKELLEQVKEQIKIIQKNEDLSKDLSEKAQTLEKRILSLKASDLTETTLTIIKEEIRSLTIDVKTSVEIMQKARGEVLMTAENINREAEEAIQSLKSATSGTPQCAAKVAALSDMLAPLTKKLHELTFSNTTFDAAKMFAANLAEAHTKIMQAKKEIELEMKDRLAAFTKKRTEMKAEAEKVGDQTILAKFAELEQQDAKLLARNEEILASLQTQLQTAQDRQGQQIKNKKAAAEELRKVISTLCAEELRIGLPGQAAVASTLQGTANLMQQAAQLDADIAALTTQKIAKENAIKEKQKIMAKDAFARSVQDCIDSQNPATSEKHIAELVRIKTAVATATNLEQLSTDLQKCKDAIQKELTETMEHFKADLIKAHQAAASIANTSLEAALTALEQQNTIEGLRANKARLSGIEAQITTAIAQQKEYQTKMEQQAKKLEKEVQNLIDKQIAYKITANTLPAKTVNSTQTTAERIEAIDQYIKALTAVQTEAKEKIAVHEQKMIADFNQEIEGLMAYAKQNGTLSESQFAPFKSVSIEMLKAQTSKLEALKIKLRTERQTLEDKITRAKATETANQQALATLSTTLREVAIDLTTKFESVDSTKNLTEQLAAHERICAAQKAVIDQGKALHSYRTSIDTEVAQKLEHFSFTESTINDGQRQIKSKVDEIKAKTEIAKQQVLKTQLEEQVKTRLKEIKELQSKQKDYGIPYEAIPEKPAKTTPAEQIEALKQYITVLSTIQDKAVQNISLHEKQALTTFEALKQTVIDLAKHNGTYSEATFALFTSITMSTLKEKKSKLEALQTQLQKELLTLEAKIQTEKISMGTKQKALASITGKLGSFNIILNATFNSVDSTKNLSEQVAAYEQISLAQQATITESQAILSFLESQKTSIDQKVAHKLNLGSFTEKTIQGGLAEIKTKFAELKKIEIEKQIQQLQEHIIQEKSKDDKYTVSAIELQDKNKIKKDQIWIKEFKRLKWIAIEEAAKKQIRHGMKWSEIDLLQLWGPKGEGVREAKTKADARYYDTTIRKKVLIEEVEEQLRKELLSKHK